MINILNDWNDTDMGFYLGYIFMKSVFFCGELSKTREGHAVTFATSNKHKVVKSNNWHNTTWRTPKPRRFFLIQKDIRTHPIKSTNRTWNSWMKIYGVLLWNNPFILVLFAKENSMTSHIGQQKTYFVISLYQFQIKNSMGPFLSKNRILYRRTQLE